MKPGIFLPHHLIELGLSFVIIWAFFSLFVSGDCHFWGEVLLLSLSDENSLSHLAVGNFMEIVVMVNKSFSLSHSFSLSLPHLLSASVSHCFSLSPDIISL